jgi:hypothetical protein
MSASLDLHRLFYTDAGYLKELRVPDKDQATLSHAREQIRATLRNTFREWRRHVSTTTLSGSAPKFRIQGSFAYHTTNDCQQTPPQQIDQDDGMFLPVSFVANNGGTHPDVSSQLYFEIVETALATLCAQEGWRLNPFGPKDSCVRVGINDRLHIDLPLYAIKDEAFEQLAEASATALKRAGVAMDAMAQDQTELLDSVYRALGESEIVLAHRREGWIASDPRKLEIWFDSAMKAFGPIVRRLSRVFKGLRDANWTECQLGSICIMAAVVQAVMSVSKFENNRDDLAVLAVGRELVRIFASPIENPVFPGDPDKYLCKDWSAEFREEVRSVFAGACDKLERAIYATLLKGHAINLVREAFGERIPQDETLVIRVGAAAIVREKEPERQPRPMVPRTKSG